jgi:hypothetical protein
MGSLTPRKVDGNWVIDVPAGIPLTGAAGQYGTTRAFSMPAIANAGTGKSK